MFREYYEKNWGDDPEPWVRCYSNRLPTRGTHDTNAAESLHNFIKDNLREVFHNKKGKMEKIIDVLPKIMTKRLKEKPALSSTEQD